MRKSLILLIVSLYLLRKLSIFLFFLKAGKSKSYTKASNPSSKQSEFTSDLGSRSRWSIFSNRVSKLSPVDMLLSGLQLQLQRRRRQYPGPSQPASSSSSGKTIASNFLRRGLRGRGLQEPEPQVRARPPGPLRRPLTGRNPARPDCPGPGPRRPAGARTPKVASHHPDRPRGPSRRPAGPRRRRPRRAPSGRRALA